MLNHKLKKMKIILSALLILSSFLSQAQTVNYDVAVSFNSIGTGTPSEDFLIRFYKKYKKTYKKLEGFVAKGCGREGEFTVFINTKGMKSAEKNLLYKKLKELIMMEEKKNLAKNASSGHIMMARKASSTDYSHCRAGIVSWPEISK